MKKTAVVFQSKYGATRKYAEWIAEELSCDLFERKKVNRAELEPYDTILYGGGLYAGGVNGIDFLTKNFDRFRGKNLILFTCGLADPADKDNTDHIGKGLDRVFTGRMRERIKVFHLRGAIDYSRLGPVHRSMMAMLCRLTRRKDPASLRGEDREMLATYGKAVDFTDRASIAPVVEYVRGL